MLKTPTVFGYASVEPSTSMNVVSAHNVPLRQELVSTLPFGILPGFGRLMEELSAICPMNPYDEWGNEIEGMERIFPDHIQFDKVPDALPTVAKILHSEFTTTPTGALPDDGIKALNAHHVTFLHHVESDLPPGSNILILCAGNHEDLNRLDYHRLCNASNIHMVGATAPNPRAQKVLDELPGRVKRTQSYLHDVPDAWFHPEGYDLIICHHGINKITASTAGEVAFQSVLNRLKETGVFAGDKIDMQGLDTLEKFSFLPSHSVELIGFDGRAGIEGTASVRVGGVVWEDPVLSDKRLMDLVPPKFTVNIMQGRGAFGATLLSGRVFAPPPTVATAARRAETRVVSYVEIRPHRCFVVPPQIPVEAPASTWGIRDTHPAYIMDMLTFRVNRGHHFNAADIPYVGENTIYSEKTDGLEARVLISEGGAYLVGGRNSSVKMFAPLPTRQGIPIMRLQCEIVNGRVILLDPIHLGIDTPYGFESRLRHFESIIRATPAISRIIERKVWFPHFPLDQSRRWEGVVMMSVSAPSPMVSEKFCDTAIFTKWRNTIDIADPDGNIIEVDAYTGEKVRDRPDKTRPNNSRNIAGVRASIQVQEAARIVSIPYSPQLEAQDLPRWQSGDPRLIGVLCALKYPNRPHPDPEIQRHKRDLMKRVGYVKPMSVGEVVAMESLSDDAWMYDIGLEGGANSKGDGPGFGDRRKESILPVFEEILALRDETMDPQDVYPSPYILHSPFPLAEKMRYGQVFRIRLGGRRNPPDDCRDWEIKFGKVDGWNVYILVAAHPEHGKWGIYYK